MNPLPKQLQKLSLEKRIDAELLRIGIHGNVPLIADKVSQVLSTEDPSDREAILAYQLPFWAKRLAQNPTANLRVDRDPYQVEYEANSGPIAFTKNTLINYWLSLIPDWAIWQSRVINLSGLVNQFETQRKVLQNHSSRGNLILLANHIHPSDIPLLSYLIQAGYRFTREQIYVVAGPMIFSGSLEFSAMRRFANLIKTFPDTESANTGWDWIAKIRSNMVKRLLRILKTDTRNPLQKVVIICPSGTHDKLDIDGNYQMAKPSSTTPHMITSLWRAREESIVLPIGIYGSSPLGIMGLRDPRQVTIQFWDIQNADELGVSAAISELPSCVQNEFWKKMASWAQ
jgi:1-acyl-sn-glycerol-3-phosphate acyltransferase